jgi:hypothetical protein
MPRGPDGRTVLTTPDAQTAARAGRWAQRQLVPFIPDTNAIEALNRQLRKAVKTKGHFPPTTQPGKLITSRSKTPSPNGPAPAADESGTDVQDPFGDRLPDRTNDVRLHT